MKVLKRYVFPVMVFLLNILTLYGYQGNNYVRVRSYYRSGGPISYKNLYLSYAFHYNVYNNITVHLAFFKGYGEPGYYPVGYFKSTDGGLYEKGSYYVYLKDYFRFNKIIIGNYTPLFGQGLLFGSVFPLFLSNPYYDVARYRDGIYPKGTTSKAVLLEGVALEYERRNMYFRPFISWNRFDCSAGESDYYKYKDNDFDGIPNEDDDDDFTGIKDPFPESYSSKTRLLSSIRNEPDYESVSARLKRNNLSEYMAGVNVSVRWDRFKAGATAAYTHFNRLIDPYYNFDSNEGDKTGHYYRGKDLLSSNIYFKLYRNVELFGEIAGTFYRKLSYYPEFNGGYSSAFGFSGGVREKVGNVGLILWGAYLPPNLINPHALEFPDGSNNFACGLFGVNFTKSSKRFSSYIYVYHEIYEEDNPGYEETGLSYSYRLEYPFGKTMTLKLKQSFEAIDNHYYAPKAMSYRIPSKASLKHLFTEDDYITLTLESRLGSPDGERLKSGTGLSAMVFFNNAEYDASFRLMYYSTDDDRFAYLYPYERTLYNWHFMPPSLKGNGLAGSFIFVKDVMKKLTLGTKFRFNIDFYEKLHNDLSIYFMTEYSF